MFKVALLPRNLAAALRDIESPKVEVRVSSAKDLARLAQDAEADQRTRALEALVRALTQDTAARVRAETALALADAAAGECTGELVDATHDREPRVRQMAILALGEVGPQRHPAARAALLAALDDPAPAIRFQALIAWPRLSPDDAMDEVSRRMTDEDAQVRYIALRIAEEHWFEGASSRERSVNLIKRARLALEDEAPKVRLAAAILLARSDDLSGANQLVEAVNGGSGAEEAEDLQTAVELCGRLELRAATPGLKRRAWGFLGLVPDRFAFQARVALAQLGDARATRAILRDLSGWSRDTRTLAVVAAGRAGLQAATAPIQAMRGDARRADPTAVEEALAALQPDGE